MWSLLIMHWTLLYTPPHMEPHCKGSHRHVMSLSMATLRSKIWCPRLETCLNLFTWWYPSELTSGDYSPQQAVRILLEHFTHFSKRHFFRHKLNPMIDPALVLLKVEVNHRVSMIFSFMEELNWNHNQRHWQTLIQSTPFNCLDLQWSGRINLIDWLR